MNVACDYEAPMQMLTTEKYIASRTMDVNVVETKFKQFLKELTFSFKMRPKTQFCILQHPTVFTDWITNMLQQHIWNAHGSRSMFAICFWSSVLSK